MNLLRYTLLPLLATALALGQSAPPSKTSDLPSQPEAVVRDLYQQVVARHPVGIPRDADMRFFAPYLSSELLHRIDLARACQADFFRQNPRPDLKPAFGWLEFGVFTGGDERASPGTFQIEKKEAEKDGAFRVVVRLTWRPPDGPGFWHVAAIVVPEENRFVVDNVVFLKDENMSPLAPAEWRLSEELSQGCEGPHWVGYGDRQGSQKPPEN